MGQPRRPARWGLRIALIVGGLLVLCCSCVALLVGRTILEIKPATTAADAYVAAVIAGDDAAAFSHVCSAQDSKSSHDAFSSRVHNENVRSHRVVNTTVSAWNLSLHATAQVELSGSNGPIETVRLPMSKEDGEWKVCSR